MPAFRRLLLSALFCSQTCLAAGTDLLGPALQNFLENYQNTLPGRMSAEIGSYPRSEKLLACQQWQISRPNGSKPWGQTSLAARCSAGPAQSLYVSVRIRVEGPLLITTRQIPNGTSLVESDLQTVEGELSTQPADLIRSEQEAIGRITRSSIPAGQALRRSLLREEAIIQAGQPVRLSLTTEQLSVSNEGIAISNASRGQSIRVRLASGKIISGIAREEGVVEIRP